jgi:hypothetical protein
MKANVVRRPSVAELVTASCQLTDEVGEPPVVGVTAALGTKRSDDVAGDLFSFGKEVPGSGVQEGEAGGRRSRKPRPVGGPVGASWPRPPPRGPGAQRP